MTQPLPATGHGSIADNVQEADLAIRHALEAPHHLAIPLQKGQIPPYPPANMQLDCTLHYLATALDVPPEDIPSFHLIRLNAGEIRSLLASPTGLRPGASELSSSLKPNGFLALVIHHQNQFLSDHSRRIELAIKASLAVPLQDFVRKMSATTPGTPMLMRYKWTCAFAIPTEDLPQYTRLWNRWMRICRARLRPFPIFFGRNTRPFTTRLPNGHAVAIQSFSAKSDRQMLSAIRKLDRLGIQHHPDSHAGLTGSAQSSTNRH